MWDSVPTSMTLMMQFCYLKGKLKCRSLLGTLFPLPTNPFLPSCSTFLPHFFFVICISCPSGPLYLFLHREGDGAYKGAASLKGGEGVLEWHWPCQ